MKYPAAANLVMLRIGLDTDSLGASAFPNAVAEHMCVLGLADEGIYVACLANDPHRFQELVERLIVRETWFFRIGELFRQLAHSLSALLRFRTSQRPFRVLSLPCSTGEEPYSLALTFLDAGLPVEQWRIDAVDLSPLSLDVAARGVYREPSFRQTPLEVRERHFRPLAGAWELSPEIRRLVAFRCGNILDPSLVQEFAHTFDLIVCRNLLIYLTAGARRQAFGNLEAMLAPDGLLALGHAEPQILADRPFQRVGPEGCFLFRRTHSGEPHPQSVPPAFVPAALAIPPRPAAPTLLMAPQVMTAMPRANSAIAAAPIAVGPSAESSLRRARDLADSNRLDDAFAQCQHHLTQHGPSADAYALLGLVQQARGNIDAALDDFRKTLYLDPAHREALTHAMLLTAQRGDAARAAILRERLARIPSGDTP